MSTTIIESSKISLVGSAIKKPSELIKFDRYIKYLDKIKKSYTYDEGYGWLNIISKKKVLTYREANVFNDNEYTVKFKITIKTL